MLLFNLALLYTGKQAAYDLKSKESNKEFIQIN